MFEDATFDSSNLQPAATPRWMLLALTVNLAVVAAMITLPLLYPDSLPGRILRQTLEAPTPTPAQPAPIRSLPAQLHTAPISFDPFIPPTHAPMGIDTTQDTAPAMTDPFGTAGPGNNVTGASPSTSVFQSTVPRLVVQQAHPSKTSISQGVAEGLLLPHAMPSYPSIARAAGISGTVVLAATISTTGTIDNLRVISGSPMLTQAAVSAVKTWRYRPYRLNNQPVEVETTINVVFSMGSR